MKRTILFCTALGTAVDFFAPGAAKAATPVTAPSIRQAAFASDWISVEALTARLTISGYRVVALTRVHGRFWRAEITKADSASFRVFLAPDGTPLPELSLSPLF